MAEVIGVRFKNMGKVYYFDPNSEKLSADDHVVVETARGVECGEVAMANRDVADDSIVQPLKKVIRKATKDDLRRVAENELKAKNAFTQCEKKIAERGLEMKLVDVEYTFDNSKILFYFTVDGRVDFRELVKDLAGMFRTRIELRQIGVRDEAKMIGGLGICGRPFCCGSFLGGFQPVSIKMAKEQGLSLNPVKISGTCGRLMCCLKYEQDAYEDALKRMPKNDSFVQTPDGPGNICDVNVLKETVHVRLDEKPEAPRCYHSCELCVLRNGKGSRDGIQVPQERPARYVEERKEDEFPMPLVIADFDPDAPAREERPARRRNERRRRGGGSKPQQTAEKVPEKREKPRPPEKKRPDGPRADDKPRRPRRKPGDKPQENRPQPPKGGAPKPSQKPAENAAPQEGAQSRRRPRHRGGRRRSGGGGTPAAEG